MEDHNASLRARSGSITSRDPLVSILYTLLRDGVISQSQLEEAVREEIDRGTNLEVIFTNGYLASYAIDVAQRIDALRKHKG